MRNLKLSLITGALTIAAVTPTAFASTSGAQSFVETNHGWVSYHSAASLSSPITGKLLLGNKAPLIAKTNAYWYEIKWNGQDVYITTNTNYTHVVTESTSGTSSGSSTSTVTSSTAPAGTTSSSATTTTTYVETNHGWVSYHSAASLSSPIAGKLLLGDKAPLIVKTNAYWYEIKWNGQDVYITTNANYTHLVTAPSNGTSSTQPATQTATPTPTSTSLSASSVPTTEPSWQGQADQVIATAKTQLNVPYLWGKQEPGIGFDCSNFTAWSFRTALGISFSGSSVTQRNSVGTPVSLSDIREGDLLFFATKNNSTGSGHVGIYMGNGMVIQEGGGWGKVTIEPLQGTWLGRNLVFARRVIQ